MSRRAWIVVTAMAVATALYVVAWISLAQDNESGPLNLWWPGMHIVMALVWIPLAGFVAWLLTGRQPQRPTE